MTPTTSVAILFINTAALLSALAFLAIGTGELTGAIIVAARGAAFIVQGVKELRCNRREPQGFDVLPPSKPDHDQAQK